MKSVLSVIVLVSVATAFSSCRDHSGDPAGTLKATPEKGLPNSTVVLTGGNFSTTPSSNYVEFAGIPAVVDSATATTLFVTVPENATSGPIIVNTNQVAMMVNNFKILSGVVSTFATGTYVEHLAIDPQGNLYGDSSSNYVSNIVKFNGSGLADIFAGGGYGQVDAQGTAAKFGVLWGVASDQSGNIFVSQLHAVRKITPSGMVSTLAGGTTFGYDDGLGAEALFARNVGIAVDADGFVYVSDQPRIRKISPAGEVTTLAGAIGYGNMDGLGADAKFRQPEGIAVDASGNVFVSDTYNLNIRKITKDGIVTTFAGSRTGVFGHHDGTKDEALFSIPQGMAIDAAGNIFVSDSDYSTNHYYIRLINRFGKVTTLLGGEAGTTDGPLAIARISAADGIVFDKDGNLYFADTNNSAVRKITFQ